VISGGPVPSNPAQLLGSKRTVEFLNSLRDVAEMVILDTPPVLAVADASILAPLVDGTLFIMDADHSSRSAMTQSRDQLENAGARIIGAVYNNFDPSQSAAYPYYYNYYYQYYGTDDLRHGGNGSGAGGRLGHRLRRSWNQTHSDDPGGGGRAVGFERELGDRTRTTPKGR
jgi:Mrp family chromosome partitioning ATPase